MDLKLNFVSTVVIGRFNPSILTVEFLKNECGIEIGEGKTVSPAQVLIATEIHFREKGTQFLADLERFQVRESEISDIAEARSPEFVKIYLEKLPYTPIVACGVNFAYTIHLEEADKKGFQTFLSNEVVLFDLFQIDSYDLDTERSHVNSKDTFTSLWNLNFEIKEGLKSNIRIRLLEGDNVYEMNHNIEAPNLDKDKEHLALITDNLHENITYHKDIIDKFFKGVKDA